jgi:hypothetical protein
LYFPLIKFFYLLLHDVISYKLPRNTIALVIRLNVFSESKRTFLNLINRKHSEMVVLNCLLLFYIQSLKCRRKTYSYEKCFAIIKIMSRVNWSTQILIFFVQNWHKNTIKSHSLLLLSIMECIIWLSFLMDPFNN